MVLDSHSKSATHVLSFDKGHLQLEHLQLKLKKMQKYLPVRCTQQLTAMIVKPAIVIIVVRDLSMCLGGETQFSTPCSKTRLCNKLLIRDFQGTN